MNWPDILWYLFIAFCLAYLFMWWLFAEKPPSATEEGETNTRVEHWYEDD